MTEPKMPRDAEPADEHKLPFLLDEEFDEPDPFIRWRWPERADAENS